MRRLGGGPSRTQSVLPPAPPPRPSAASRPAPPARRGARTSRRRRRSGRSSVAPAGDRAEPLWAARSSSSLQQRLAQLEDVAGADRDQHLVSVAGLLGAIKEIAEAPLGRSASGRRPDRPPPLRPPPALHTCSPPSRPRPPTRPP